MDQENILNSLMRLGLKKAEAKVYFYLSKRGPKQANEIIKALKMKKQQLYPLIKSLQGKAVLNSTMDYPAKFSVVSLEQFLELLTMAKMEEVKIIKQNKGNLLSDWQSISLSKTEDRSAKFSIIKGKKYVYSKIQQMIRDTKDHISIISSLSELFRAEQFGVLDFIQSHSRKANIDFRIITEVSKNHLEVAKQLLKKINPHIKIKGRNINVGLSLFPRIIIRDNEEILYFISSRLDTSDEQNNYDSLFTNCVSIIKPLSSVFENLWQNSTEIEKKIREIETGTPSKRTLIIKDPNLSWTKYTDVLKNAKKDILIASSSEGLAVFQKQIPIFNELANRGISVRIMSSIKNQNLEIAKNLSVCTTVRHVSAVYLDTIIVDETHLFHLNSTHQILNGSKKNSNFKNIYYTNDYHQTKKTKNILENLWKDSRTFSLSTLKSIIKPPPTKDLTPNQFPYFEIFKKMINTKSVDTDQSFGKLTEKELLNKVITAPQSLKPSTLSPKKGVAYGSLGLAIIDPPHSFYLPKMLFKISKIEDHSTFGAENVIVIFQWIKQPKRFFYVPVAIVQDNPKTTEGWKMWYSGTPASHNVLFAKKDELTIRVHGNSIFAGWTINIPLLEEQNSLPPAAILLEGYGDMVTGKFARIWATGIKTIYEFNGFPAFITFFHPVSIYSGPGTEGYLSRDSISRSYLPEAKNRKY